MLESVQPDIGLVSTLIGLGRVIPEQSRETARAVVRAVTDELEERLRAATVQAVTGALNRAARTRRPGLPTSTGAARSPRTSSTTSPSTGRSSPSGSSATRGARPRSSGTSSCASTSPARWPSRSSTPACSARCSASLRSVRTSLVVFDTAVVDLTDELDDPVDVLFGVQLGGGTDINRALAYCQGLIESARPTRSSCSSPTSTRAASPRRCCAAAPSIVGLGRDHGRAAGAQSTPALRRYDAAHAAALAGIGVPAFACTPDLFPDLMAAAIERRDLGGLGGLERHRHGARRAVLTDDVGNDDGHLELR